MRLSDTVAVGRFSIRRFAALTVACVLALFGWIGTFSYAIPALNDFHNALAPLSQTIVVNLILWVSCIGAWVVAVRFAWFALRKNHPSLPS
jgi:nitric oxide reductase large subunit